MSRAYLTGYYQGYLTKEGGLLSFLDIFDKKDLQKDVVQPVVDQTIDRTISDPAFADKIERQALQRLLNHITKGKGEYVLPVAGGAIGATGGGVVGGLFGHAVAEDTKNNRAIGTAVGGGTGALVGGGLGALGGLALLAYLKKYNKDLTYNKSRYRSYISI
jgi:hypothetical protein